MNFWLSAALALGLAIAPRCGHAVTEGMALLYGDTLPILPSGEPLVTIGIATGQKEVRLRALGRLGVEYIEAGLRKQTVVPAQSILTFALDPRGRAVPAQRRYYVDVQGVGGTAPAAVAAAQKKWQARGLPDVTSIGDGTALDLPGRRLDTRAQRIVVPCADRPAAQAQAQALSRRFGIVARVAERLATQPQANLLVGGPTGPLARAQNYARIFSLDQHGIEVRDVVYGKGYAWQSQGHRTYRGDLYVTVDPNAQLAVVNAVGLETLLQGVVPAEIFASAPPAALRAQAVAARNTVLAKVGHRHHDAPFHLCAEQHCQVYAGLGPEDPRSHAAVQDTFGQALFLDGHLVDAVYSASCGGHTENNDAAWGDLPDPALRGRPDFELGSTKAAAFAQGLSERDMKNFLSHPPQTFCAQAPQAGADKFRWQRYLPAHALNALVTAQYPHLGRLRDAVVLRRGRGGRVMALRLVGEAGTQVISHELAIRQALGNLNSASFVLSLDRGPDGFLRALSLQGAGWGHGVGLCQVGAMGRAAAGHSAADILAHYYNGAQLTALWGPQR